MKSRPSYSRATGEIAQLLRKIDGEVALNLFREAMPRNDEIRCPPRSGWEVARGRLPGIAVGSSRPYLDVFASRIHKPGRLQFTGPYK